MIMHRNHRFSTGQTNDIPIEFKSGLRPDVCFAFTGSESPFYQNYGVKGLDRLLKSEKTSR